VEKIYTGTPMKARYAILLIACLAVFFLVPGGRCGSKEITRYYSMLELRHVIFLVVCLAIFILVQRDSMQAKEAFDTADLVVAPTNGLRDFMAQNAVRWKSGPQNLSTNKSLDFPTSGVDPSLGPYIEFKGIANTTQSRQLSVQPYTNSPVLRQGWSGTVSWVVSKSRKPSPASSEDTLDLQTSLDNAYWTTVKTYRPMLATETNYSSRFVFATPLAADTYLRIAINSSDIGKETHARFYSLTISPNPLLVQSSVPRPTVLPHEIHVSWASGSDGAASNVGTPTAPYKTISAALGAARALRVSDAGRPVSIYLHPGDHWVPSGLQLTAADSGLTLAPADGLSATIRQGAALAYEGFVPLNAATHSFVYSRIPASVRGSVVVARIPEGIQLTDAQWGYGVKNKSKRARLFVDGRPCTIARYPKAGTKQADLPRLVASKQSGTGPTSKGGPDGGGVFAYTSSFTRPETWEASDDIWLTGVFNVSWKALHNSATFNTVTKRATFTRPHTEPLSYLGNERAWFYAENVAEELLLPGEYYVDAVRRLVFLVPPAGWAPDVSIDMWRAGESGISMTDVIASTFKKITFKFFSSTVIGILGGERVVIEGCRFINSHSEGVSMNTSACNVRGCDFAELGDKGVHMRGGSYGGEVIVPGDNAVENSTFDECGRYAGAYCCGVQISGVSNAVRGCTFVAADGNFINCAQGHGMTIEDNKFYDCMRFYDDMGCIYTNTSMDPRNVGHVIKNNYFHGKNTSLGAFMASGEPFHRRAIYLDNGSCGWTITKNVFYAMSDSTIFYNGGGWNYTSENLFVDCRTPLRMSLVYAAPVSSWAIGLAEAASNNWISIYNTILSLPGFKLTDMGIRFPWLSTLLLTKTPAEVFDHRTNEFTDNVFYNPNVNMQEIIQEGSKSEASKVIQRNNTTALESVTARAWASDHLAKDVLPSGKDILAPSPTPTVTTRAPTLTPSPTTRAPTFTPAPTTRAPTLTPAPTLAPTSAAPLHHGDSTLTPSSTPTTTTRAPTFTPSPTPTVTTRAPTLTPSPTTRAPTFTPAPTTRAPTLTPAPTLAPTSAAPLTPSPTTPPMPPPTHLQFSPNLVILIHEGEWMQKGMLKVLTLRNSTPSVQNFVHKDLTQVFAIDANGSVRTITGQGEYVNHETNCDGVIGGTSISRWRFVPRNLPHSYALEVVCASNLGTKRIEYNSIANQKALYLSSKGGEETGWFVLAVARVES